MKRPRPDTRPSWSDPSLPCIRDYTMPSGEHKLEVDPTYESRYRAHLLSTSAQPGWREDPTYNLKRTK